jgi:hypothetical protein
LMLMMMMMNGGSMGDSQVEFSKRLSIHNFF